MNTFVLKENQQMFFTSDTHFWHTNVMLYSSRPFRNVKDMNNTMIANWNSKVKKGDIVFFLGDLAFCSQQKRIDLINELNGRIYWIEGNHDHLTELKKDRIMNNTDNILNFSSYEFIKVQFKGQRHEIVLCHYPFHSWNKKHFGSIHLHGHSHGMSNGKIEGRILDVGVDCHNFYPISLDEVLALV